MTNRILDFSNSPAHLHARGGTLEIKLPDNQIHSIAFEDIASVIVSHPQVTISQSALARLSSAGAVLVITNEKYMPVAMTMPIESHWYQAERFIRQAAMASPKKKRIWQQIVREKIINQSRVLIAERGADLGLLPMSKLVLSGDTGNVEARAARSYWPKLFNDKTFFRSNEDDPRNGILNYGYAVLRASVARSISAAGLHPSFGLHHVNKLNAYPLADDLMEPFRPLVDAQVLKICKDTSLSLELLPPTKQALLQILASRFNSNGEQRSLFDILGRMAQSLASVILGKSAKFEIGLDSPFPVVEED